MTRSAVETQMAAWGDGARAVVHVKWNGTRDGHVFIAEQVDGVTMFLDPQSGEMDVSSSFDDSYLNETELLRLDTNELVADAIQCMD